MPRLDINFAETPDVIPPIPAGTYFLDITSAPKIELSKKQTSNNLVVEFKVVSDDALFNGRSIRDYINMGTDPEMKLRSDVRIKQLCRSAGLTVGPEGVDTEDLAGKRVQAILKPRSYEKDGVQQQGTNIEAYLVR